MRAPLKLADPLIRAPLSLEPPTNAPSLLAFK